MGVRRLPMHSVHSIFDSKAKSCSDLGVFSAARDEIVVCEIVGVIAVAPVGEVMVRSGPPSGPRGRWARMRKEFVVHPALGVHRQMLPRGRAKVTSYGNVMVARRLNLCRCVPIWFYQWFVIRLYGCAYFAFISLVRSCTLLRLGGP